MCHDGIWQSTSWYLQGMEQELPPGWRLEGSSALVWTQEHGSWLMRAVCELAAPFDGPIKVEIRLVGSLDAVEAADRYGIPVEALRAFPLREVKAQARSLVPRVRRALGMAPQLPELPQVCRTDADYARWALAYQALKEEKTTSPVKVLMEWTGMAQSTVSTRIGKARKLGFIGADGAEKAQEAIDQEGN